MKFSFPLHRTFRASCCLYVHPFVVLILLPVNFIGLPHDLDGEETKILPPSPHTTAGFCISHRHYHSQKPLNLFLLFQRWHPLQESSNLLWQLMTSSVLLMCWLCKHRLSVLQHVLEMLG